METITKKDDGSLQKTTTQVVDIQIIDLLDQRGELLQKITDLELNRDQSVVNIIAQYNKDIDGLQSAIDGINALLDQAKSLGVKSAETIITK